MKRILTTIVSLLLSMALVLTMTSCGGRNKNQENQEITWHMMKPSDNLSSQNLVEEEANRIIQEEIGAKLKFDFIDAGSWAEKMNVMINSGEEFDIFQTSSDSAATSIVMNAKKGTFMDLTELLDKYGQDIKAKVDPRAWDAVTFDGKILAIPSQAKWVPELGYVFKKDLVEKYNFDYKSVKSLKDLEPYFDILLENEPDIIPAYVVGAGNGSGLEESYHGKYTPCDVPGVLFDEDKEEFVDFLSAKLDEYKLKHEWYKKGYIAADALSRTDSAESKTGKYAVLTQAGAITLDGSKSTAVYGYPCVEIYVGMDKIPPQNIMNGNAISATCKNPEKAMQLLNLIWKDDYLINTLAYGVEGVNYAYESGKGTDSPTVVPKTGSERTWAVWHNWMGPLWAQWNSSWNSTEALQEMKKANETAEMSKTVGVMFDMESILTEVAALTGVVNASSPVLFCGAMDDFDKYTAEVAEKLKEAGIEKVLEELNRQYQEQK
ncbi:MAG: DUF3502 domain-containing protein [Clostridia bacterium]|nr:DUF3502 domain-containing protein [Clostridia bacterium]